MRNVGGNLRMKKLCGIVLIVMGLMLLGTGLFFKLNEWPDSFFGIYTGPTLIFIGLILLIFNKKAN